MIDLAARQGMAKRWRASLNARASRCPTSSALRQLRRHKLVNSVRGPGGGYRLARAMDEITVADIIAVDEPMDATQCGGKETATTITCA